MKKSEEKIVVSLSHYAVLEIVRGLSNASCVV